MLVTQPDLDRFRSDSFEPVSLRERGATAPFTTPLLLNARVRKATFGRGYEMVVANPSGGRGALIMPWSVVPEVCSLSLFDQQLWKHLGEADDISPIGIRQEAQRLAVMGLAGRRAANAAREAQQREDSSRRLATSLLMDSLISAAETSEGAKQRSFERGEDAFFKRAEAALARAASNAGMSSAEFVSDLELLSSIMSSTVSDMEGDEGRLRQTLARLNRVTDEIAAWTAKEKQEGGHIVAARFIEQTARQTIECSEFTLSVAEELIANFGKLTPVWKDQREAVIERTRWPEWVLDGWRTPLALWEATAPRERQVAIWEMAMIVPILPREAKAWLGQQSAWSETPRRVAQMVRDKADWRGGKMLEMMARNENLIGFSISYENRISAIGSQTFRTSIPSSRADKRPEPAGGSAKHHQGSRSHEEISEAKGAEREPGKRNAFADSRVISSRLATASDQTLTKIVAIVERMANPEVHQRILGPSLPRIKQLRPPRQASLMRLLCLPLSGALVEASQWRRAEGRIPRSAVAPLTEALLVTCGAKAQALSEQLGNARMDDVQVMHRVGGALWQLAAEAAPQMRPGPSWSGNGLSPADFAAITQFAAALWRHGEPLWKAMGGMAGDSPPETLHAALMGPAGEGRLVLMAAIDTLLQNIASPSLFVIIMDQMPQQTLSIVEEALRRWVGTTLPELPEENFATGAHLAAEISIVINALQEPRPGIQVVEAKELATYRRTVSNFCLGTYREVVLVHVIQSLSSLQGSQIDELSQIEAMARIARSLEDTGRRLGVPQGYDDIRGQAQSQLEALLDKVNNPSAASAMDIARIEEILIGQEAAERFLYRARRQWR